LYLRPLVGAGLPSGTLIVGQSLMPRQQALHRILLILLLVGGVGLLLAIFGAWFLTGRALIPIQAAFNRQQEFVADAAHELRTPLMSLRAATDLLAQHTNEPLAVHRDLFDDVRSELLRLERLTSDLLTLARSDLETLDLALGAVDLGVLAADVVRKTLPLAQEHDVQLTLDRLDVPLSIEADPDRLQQVFLILLDNALKHTPAGGTVTVSVTKKGSEARLVIHDTGIGIPPEALPRLFDRFYRVNHARTRRDGGAGLGLAIARRIIEAHGGQIAIMSTPGDGTSAIIRLPANARLDHVTVTKSVGSIRESLPHPFVRR
jgi:signal transduction histidine kinase